MIKSESKLKNLAKILSGRDSLIISEAIESLRNDEPFEGAVTLLCSYYDSSDNNHLRRAIENFLNDIKDQSVTKEIMAQAKKPYKSATVSMLVASCWQSGLDYSEYVYDLTEIFIRSDYLTAVECLTTIEESTHSISSSMKESLLGMIAGCPSCNTGEKAPLAHELVSVIRNIRT